MLSEAIIKISPKDRENLFNYIRALKRVTTQLLKNGAIPYSTVLQELNEFSSRWDSKVAKNLRIRYEYIRGKYKGQYIQDGTTINMNLTAFVKVNSNGTEATIVSIDILGMVPIFFHEFMHYKQDMKIRSKHFGHYLQALDHKDFKSYFQDPQERQAWAIQYLEYLRQNMKITKPEEVLSQLKKMGLLHDKDLNNLKNTDYASWKAIMKNIVVTALRDLKTSERFSGSSER